MTVERQKGTINFICDSCGEFIEDEDGDFGKLWAKAKEEGWKAWKREDDGIWQHQCQTCA